MSRPRIFADFHNTDQHGRLRLNCAGTADDLARCRVQLEEGMQILVYSGELELDGQVGFSDEEKIWVANVDWDAIRNLHTKANTLEMRERDQVGGVNMPLPTGFDASLADLSIAPNQ
jgi:hypothetical protein